MPNFKTITPQEFKDAFIKSVSSNHQEIVALWNARKRYTALMLENIFQEIADELSIKVYNANYYYLDSIFYSERDSDHFGPTAVYAKSIGIAMEHEHIIDDTAIEMNKLQLFNAPLKVLITYAQTPELRSNYLRKYEKIIQGADIFGDIASLRRQLVIFGSISQQTVKWHFHVYETSGFREMDTAEVCS